MAKRYSGAVIVTVVYDDHDFYKATVTVPNRTVWSGRIYPPASGYGKGVAYDSPTAYDRTARAAISFARDEHDIDSRLAFGDHDVHLGRSVATRRPKQENPRKRKPARKAPAKRKRPATKRAKPRKRSKR